MIGGEGGGGEYVLIYSGMLVPASDISLLCISNVM